MTLTKTGTSLGLALGVALLGSTAMGEPFRLIVTHLEPPLVPNSIQDMAADRGYFEEEGVEVDLVRVQQTPSAVAALQSGEGEMANISVEALVQLVLGGSPDMRAVTSPNKSLPFLIASSDEIASPEDLAGASFGVGRIGSLDYTLSGEVLSGYRLEWDDLELVALGQPSVRGQALSAGQVDATTMSIGVWSELPDQTGLHILVPQDAYYEAAPVVNKVNVVLQETLDERGDEVEGVIRALIRASRDVADNPQLWVDYMSEVRPDVAPETLDMLAESFAGGWEVNGGLNAEELQFTQDFLYQSEDFADQREVTLAEWVDFGPVDNVLADLGTAEGASDMPVR
ncbi:ABC transporter substrate-binding protein [Pseudoroseicyclus sp. H15]